MNHVTLLTGLDVCFCECMTWQNERAGGSRKKSALTVSEQYPVPEAKHSLIAVCPQHVSSLLGTYTEIAIPTIYCFSFVGALKRAHFGSGKINEVIFGTK